MRNLTEQDRLFLKIIHNTPIEQLEETFRQCGVPEESITEFLKIYKEK